MTTSTLQNITLSQLVARLCQLLFHPILMGVVMTYLIMYGYALPMRQASVELTRFVICNVALVTIGVPAIFRVLIRFFGVERSGGSYRVKVLSLGIFFLSLVCCGAIFANAPTLFILRKMFYAGAIVCVVTLLFELFYSLCYQTVALGAVLGIMWVLLYIGSTELLFHYIVLIVATGLVATSHLYLGEYRVGRVLWAIPIGFVVAALSFILL